MTSAMISRVLNEPRRERERLDNMASVPGALVDWVAELKSASPHVHADTSECRAADRHFASRLYNSSIISSSVIAAIFSGISTGPN